MNFNGLTFLTASVLYSQSDYLNHSNKNSGWLYESVKHADDTVSRFENKLCFEN